MTDEVADFYSDCFDAERAAALRLQKAIDDNKEDGLVAVCTQQLDCDCAEFFTVRHVAADFDTVDRALDDVYACAEGPVRWHIGKPSENKPGHRSGRDLAMEAFEDGHPHSVTW